MPRQKKTTRLNESGSGSETHSEPVNVNLANFLKAVTEKKYAEANKYLRGAIDVKLVNAIRNSVNR